jgi:hypothetical protein
VQAFPDALARHGRAFAHPLQLDIPVDKRMPAWILQDRKAVFGWVFRKVFDEERRRPFFGSAERGPTGDWKSMIEDGHENMSCARVLESAAET